MSKCVNAVDETIISKNIFPFSVLSPRAGGERNPGCMLEPVLTRLTQNLLYSERPIRSCETSSGSL